MRSVDLYSFLSFFMRISKSSLQSTQLGRFRSSFHAVLHIILTGWAFRSPWWKFQSASHSCLSPVINHSSFIPADWPSLWRPSHIQSRLGSFSGRKKIYKNIDEKYNWQSLLLIVVCDGRLILCNDVTAPGLPAGGGCHLQPSPDPVKQPRALLFPCLALK